MERVDFFVSHAWEDSGARKLRMLREFLCLQALMGRILVITPTLAIFLLPLGFGMSSHVPEFPEWLPSSLPLTVLAFILTWIALSLLGAWPDTMTPWAMTPTLLWVDTCCLCNDTPQTIAKGVEGFQRFLGASDRMVAIVSTTCAPSPIEAWTVPHALPAL